MRPRIAEPDRCIPGELISAVGHREGDARQFAAGLYASDEEIFSQAAGQLDTGEGGEFCAHPGPQRSGIEQAGNRSAVQSFQGNVYDRPRGQGTTAGRWQCPEIKSHCGAAPVMACSESTTRNTD